MAVPVSGPYGVTKSFFRRTWALTAPYWRSDQWRWAWGLLVSVVALTLGLVYINVLINDWYRQFYNALEQRDFGAFQYLILYFAGLATVYIVAAVYRIYLTQMLEIRWRSWLTDRYVSRWLDNQAYYRLELQNRGTDNPDQRIAEDLRLYTTGTLSLALGLLSSVVTLISFVVILWAISGPLAFTLGGLDIVIPGYMVWAAVLYAIVGSVLTHFIGRRLIGINFLQERYEADFRFSLVRLRENAEGVALYHGERPERAHLMGRFGNIQTNWWQLMQYTKRLTFFTAGYSQVAIIFPILVAAPRYFAGELTLGGLQQIGNAFRQVETSLSWFINVYENIANWKASVDRLLTFEDALIDIAVDTTSTERVEVTPAPTPVLRAEGLNLALPTGAAVLSGASFAVEPGERVLVKGPSGSGKSTLFRALAGIWPFGRGRVERPVDATVLFLPQRPYIPIGTLREAVSYPAGPDAFGDDEIRAVLEDVKLGAFADHLDEADNWSLRMSGGEQQRLAVARALLHRPDWLFMDEATSALDEPTEQHLYGLLRERLSNAAIVNISHRPADREFHDRTFELVPNGGPAHLRMEPATDGRAGAPSAQAPAAG
ncbi:MAG: ABC transporter ATP-binding protein/permease [Chloroflexota bacterium]|nr:ABC transporter ATP-binding protein/permease [Chloroflexota bacterium]